MSDMVKKLMIGGSIGVIAIIIFIFNGGDEQEGAHFQELQEIASEESLDGIELDSIDMSSIVMVDVKGEVNKPGVYELDINARVDDVIQLAGGFTEQAAVEQINLAQKVQDEMIIVVQKLNKDGEILGPAVSSSSGGSDKVRVNYATQQEMETLSGIGPSKAQAIIQHREEHGLFKAPEDLMQVSGIGERTFENIEEHIQIP